METTVPHTHPTQALSQGIFPTSFLVSGLVIGGTAQRYQTQLSLRKSDN